MTAPRYLVLPDDTRGDFTITERATGQLYARRATFREAARLALRLEYQPCRPLPEPHAKAPSY